MYIFWGAKGNSLGAKVAAELWPEIGNNYVAFDIDDCDATKYDEVERALSIILAHEEIIEGVVIFVGKMRNARIEDETPEGVIDLFETNALSLFNIAKGLYPIFKAQGSGTLIHIGSNSAVMGFSGMLSYCASKFASRGMIQVIAKEYIKIGATANQINPCAFEPGSSEMSNAQFEQFAAIQKMDEVQTRSMLVSRIPAGRLTSVDDLVTTIRFLLFDASPFITGQSINLSGGMVM